MTLVRRNVWQLGDDWAEPILWYARGVAGMKKRTLAEPTSWLFYAAIHGFNEGLWTQLGYFDPNMPLPSPAVVKQFWAQCQHGSWYFLPWHRGYLLAFEANIRAVVVELGGPADWALPYWNYFNPLESKLPPAFASPDWPDGSGDNPLFVEPRYGPDGDGNVIVPIEYVNLNAMGDHRFTGAASGGSPGFGGIDTGFSHGGQTHGGIESQPHDVVHGLVGGAEHNNHSRPGAMSKPDSAALDPIFWLHHANIDRLWQSWNNTTPPHFDPKNPNWSAGPAKNGQRPFVMPMPDGTSWTYIPGQMADPAKLGYEYDDLAPGAPTPVSRRVRLEQLGFAGPPPPEGGALAGQPAQPEPPAPAEPTVELVGANTQSVVIRGSQVHSDVRLDSGMRRKVAMSLTAPAEAPAEPAEPDRVFLNLENVRGPSDAAVLRVYVGVPAGQDPAAHPELLAGSIAPFGVSKASAPDDEHGGQGLTFVLEITDIVDRLHLSSSFDVDSLPVRIVPMHPLAGDAAITVGRISIFRQGR